MKVSVFAIEEPAGGAQEKEISQCGEKTQIRPRVFGGYVEKRWGNDLGGDGAGKRARGGPPPESGTKLVGEKIKFGSKQGVKK